LHEDLRTHVLEQKTKIEMLQKRDAENQKSIATLDTRLKSYEGNDSGLAPRFCNVTIFSKLTVFFYFRLPEQLANKPSIDELSAKLEVLQAEHDSLQDFLKKSSEKEAREKKEREEKHAQDIAELGDKLKKSNARIKTLVAKAKTSETEADDIDKMIFHRDLLLFPASSC
jgi:DNA repair exonuclease SbcCD ATPase subunit